MKIKKIFTRYVTLSCIVMGCASDDIEEKYGYGKEPAYAFGIAGVHVVSYTTKTAVFEYDFILYDENGIVSTDKFELGLDDITFTGGTVMDFDLLDLTEVHTEPKGCYDVAVLFEHNAMERPERMEVAARTIFKNTPDCSNFVFSWYPDRDKSLAVIADYNIEGADFTRDPFLYDQILAHVSYANLDLYKKKETPYSSQFTALGEVIKFSMAKSETPNKQVLLLYENNNEDDNTSLDDVANYAIDNGIVLHAVRSDDAADDHAMIKAVNATGGIYCYQDDIDFFHARNKSDSYAFAANADKFFSGDYLYYRARFKVDTNKSFSSGYWFQVPLPILLPNDVQKSLPVYVTFD